MSRVPRVLVVDDDRDILELLSYNLGKAGFRVKVMDNSSKAISYSVRFKPDLIILDIVMPPVNGIEVCKQIRAIPALADTYIFFLSGQSEPYYREAAMKTGADDFEDKIIGLRTLIQKVISILKGNDRLHKS